MKNPIVIRTFSLFILNITVRKGGGWSVGKKKKKTETVL